MSFKSFESSSDKYSTQQEEKFSEEESKKYYSSEYEDKFKEYDQKDVSTTTCFHISLPKMASYQSNNSTVD